MPTRNTTRPTAAPIPTTASSPDPDTSAKSTATTSDIDLDDGLHPDEAADHHDRGATEHDLSDCLVEQRRHVVGVDDVHGEAQRDRQDREDVGADAPLSRERLDVAAQTLAVRHRLGNGHEQL